MITSFSGKYFFLSNFYECEILYEGISYPSAEHAYVAAKSDDVRDREYVATIKTAGQVKRYGRRLILRDNWDSVRLTVMRDIITYKFTAHSNLRHMLLDTGQEELVEGNYWGDTFWGQSPVGIGENNLGKILMEIRNVLG